MDSSTLASGDNQISQHISPRSNETSKLDAKQNDDEVSKDQGELASQVDDNEAKIKERIAQCRRIIESLKLELSEEKAKLEIDSKIPNNPTTPAEDTKSALSYQQVSASSSQCVMEDTTNLYVNSIDAKLNYDENLIEYEKQLQKYQNTLNMAQIEKKNAIRKQMLAKAYKLKLLEVENQCNIELLRVKQSLQCLEPLQMIVNTWKSSVEDNTYDANNLVLMPRYPELRATSGSDVNSLKENFENVSDKSESVLDTDC